MIIHGRYKRFTLCNKKRDWRKVGVREDFSNAICTLSQNTAWPRLLNDGDTAADHGDGEGGGGDAGSVGSLVRVNADEEWPVEELPGLQLGQLFLHKGKVIGLVARGQMKFWNRQICIYLLSSFFKCHPIITFYIYVNWRFRVDTYTKRV